jgi:hypothetical protein
MKSPMEVFKAYVDGQARLGYAKFNPGPQPTDVILATFPKSGSTWTSYLLHQLRSGGDDDFDDIKNEVIDITPGHWDPSVNPFLAEGKWFPRTFKTHGSYDLCPKGGRYIYIARNPADTLWSLYHFIHDLFAIDEPAAIEEFYRDYYVERFGTDHDIGNPWDHFLGWLPHRNKDNVLWLHYEDLLEDRTKCIREIANFMGIALDEARLDIVLQHSAMEHMRTIAAKINPSSDNHTGKIVQRFGPLTQTYASDMKFGKMRRGATGDGKKNLPEGIRQSLAAEWDRRITPALGYGNYEEMRADCSLLRAK